jgi:hypothetical protein
VAHDQFGYWRHVWFRVDSHPGLDIVLTVNEDGEVEGFEVHAQGGPRSFPEDRGEYGISPGPPPPEPVEAPPLTATLLRELPFAEMARLARSSLGCHLHWRQERFEEFAGMVSEVGRRQTAGELREIAEQQTRRRPPRDKGDRWYAELAVAYEDWLETNQPLKALAKQRGVSNVHTLRSQLQEARARGLLEHAPRSGGGWAAGGWATDKAKRVLKDDSADSAAGAWWEAF